MREVFISYAQELEDLIAYHALKTAFPAGGGVYVDVGANDPIQWSVTAALYNYGWRGINIEPLKKKYEALCDRRQEDININMGVSNQKGVLELLEANDLSTFSPDIKKELLDNKNIITSTSEVNIDTLTSILLGIKDKMPINQIHFCKIDVEGYEKNVIEGIDFKVIRPWIFCVEMNKQKEWEPILLQNGYSFALADSMNRWYVANEKSDLKNRLKPTKQLTNYYSVYHVIEHEEFIRKTNTSNFKKCLRFVKRGFLAIRKHGIIETIRWAISQHKDKLVNK